MTDRVRELGRHYDANYFIGAYKDWTGHAYEAGSPFWGAFFSKIADAIVVELRPRSVLDAGCGIGFLVEALRDRGIEAWGIDISKYAIEQTSDRIRPFCAVHSVTEELDRDFDLIVCIEVLEHLPADLAERAVENLTNHTDSVLFSSTPDDFREPSHIHVQPTEYWVELFARRGFQRDIDFDAEFVAPHAIRFKRVVEFPFSVISDYERWHWRTATELRELRAENVSFEENCARLGVERDELAAEVDRVRETMSRLRAAVNDERTRAHELELEVDEWRQRGTAAEQSLAYWEQFRARSGWRIYVALLELRLRLAPIGTLRDKAARLALEAVANGLDTVLRRSDGSQVVRAAPEVRRTADWASQTSAGTGAVFFLSGCPGDAKRYRCDHHAEQLQMLGATVGIGIYGEIDLQEIVDGYQCFIFHRVPFGPDVDWFIRAARTRGKPVLFDSDDLVFDPDVAHHVAALEEMSDSDRELYLNGLERYRETLLACDAVVVTTETLREFASSVHERVSVVPNVASLKMVELADEALGRKRIRRRSGEQNASVVIGYLSGTPTHNRDFLEAADAILWALDSYPTVRFLAVGHLDLDSRFKRFSDRVEQLPLQPWSRLPEILSGVDINIAPLEPANPFTDSKSCIKYVEAGLVMVPTIASPRRDFARVIAHGRNGLLADTSDEWMQALRQLIEFPQRREALARAAFEDIRRSHVSSATAPRLYNAFGAMVGTDKRSESLRVNWILRAPIPQTGGGYRTIFRIAEYLARSGHSVRIYVEPIAHLEGLPPSEVIAFCERHFGPLISEIHVGHGGFRSADVTIATNWPTAFTVARDTHSLFKAYFIQDYEPDFYNELDPEAREAEQTYSLPLRHVCIGQHLAGRISGLSGKHADVVEFAPDPAFEMTIRPENRPNPVEILFFARPGLKRRGFAIGVEALELLKRRHPKVEISFFGASEGELGGVPFEYRNLGVIPPVEVAKAMNRAHILLSFSLTNISHVPFEGMACGCAVVEANVPSVTAMVSGGATCLLADPTPAAVADTLGVLMEDAELRCRIGNAAAKEMQGRTWTRTAEQFEEILRDAAFARVAQDDIRC